MFIRWNATIWGGAACSHLSALGNTIRTYEGGGGGRQATRIFSSSQSIFCAFLGIRGTQPSKQLTGRLGDLLGILVILLLLAADAYVYCRDRLPGIAAEQLIADSNRADFVAFGREAAARAGQLRSRAAARRVIFHMKAALETALSAEEASESFEMVETAVISRGATNSQVATQDGNVTRLAIVEGAATRAGQQRQPMNDGRSGEARRSEAHTNQSYMIGTNVAAPLALPQGTRGVNGNPRNGSTEGLGLGAALMPPAGQQDARNQSAPSAFSSQSPSLSVAGPRTPFSWATPSRPGWQWWICQLGCGIWGKSRADGGLVIVGKQGRILGRSSYPAMPRLYLRQPRSGNVHDEGSTLMWQNNIWTIQYPLVHLNDQGTRTLRTFRQTYILWIQCYFPKGGGGS